MTKKKENATSLNQQPVDWCHYDKEEEECHGSKPGPVSRRKGCLCHRRSGRPSYHFHRFKAFRLTQSMSQCLAESRLRHVRTSVTLASSRYMIVFSVYTVNVVKAPLTKLRTWMKNKAHNLRPTLLRAYTACISGLMFGVANPPCVG